ncbi:hypothetical protein ES705_22808 [subsurface metagenome]
MCASIHEAGHAAVYLALGEDVLWVKIFENKWGVWLGETKPIYKNIKFVGGEIVDRDSLALILTAVYAGYYAVYAFLNYEKHTHALGDLENALNFTDGWYHKIPEFESFVYNTQKGSFKIINEHSREIKNLAQALEQRLELKNEQIRKIFYGA